MNEEIEKLRSALWSCATQAVALKQPCSDPDSPQAFRNAKCQEISNTAHIALGTINAHSVSSEQMSIDFKNSVKRAIIDLACAVIKQEDAPCSAESHFDRALTNLSALIGNDLEGMRSDIIDVIEVSREHMKMLGYPTPDPP